MFKEIPASKKSIARRKPVFGVGTNDADYTIRKQVNGRQTSCPYYVTWRSMMERCYGDKYQARYPTYKGCKVCDEWLRFSAFKAWMMKQDWRGKALDKDILKQGNKIYGPQACLFITCAINNLLNNSAAARGDYPQGVEPLGGKYRARCSNGGKYKHIGYFSTPEQAHEAYKIVKYKVIAKVANKQLEPLKSALLRYKIN